MPQWHLKWRCLIDVYFGRCEGRLGFDWMYLREFLSDFHKIRSVCNSLMVRDCLALLVDGSGAAIAFEAAMFD